MIARALRLDPRIIVADEPVSVVDASLRATILKNLLRLNKENNISILYITHDLTTAYQLCDNIVILYKGTIAEVGDVEAVIKNPAHPYTQLLVKSIPQPNPELTWGDTEDNLAAEENAASAVEECPFAPRCPNVMELCRKEKPPLYSLSEKSAATCFLYNTHALCSDMSSLLEK